MNSGRRPESRERRATHAARKRVPQAAHCQRRLAPLMGMTGMKKRVMKRMPFFSMNSPTVPHLLQRICIREGSSPQVTKRVPMMKMKNTAAPFGG